MKPAPRFAITPMRTAPSPIFADLARDIAAFATFLLLLAAVGALALTIGG